MKALILVGSGPSLFRGSGFGNSAGTRVGGSCRATNEDVWDKKSKWIGPGRWLRSEGLPDMRVSSPKEAICVRAFAFCSTHRS